MDGPMERLWLLTRWNGDSRVCQWEYRIPLCIYYYIHKIYYVQYIGMRLYCLNHGKGLTALYEIVWRWCGFSGSFIIGAGYLAFSLHKNTLHLSRVRFVYIHTLLKQVPNLQVLIIFFLILHLVFFTLCQLILVSLLYLLVKQCR